MAPKSHPKSGNRPKDTEFVGTRNPPKNKKPAHAAPSPAPVVDSKTDALPIELQQAILNVFANAFPLAENQAELRTSIQEVKGHLYRRDFTAAFGKQEYLAAYALRWSAARALAYAGLFATFDPKSRWLCPRGEEGPSSRVVCIGGGAGAETLALAAVMRHRQIPRLQIEAVDVADWSQCLQLLEKSITTTPPLLKYATISAKAANRSLLESGQLEVSSTCEDILRQTQEQLRKLVARARLITLMFTLNELFTTSIARTTAFLLALTDAVEVGARLLVVDSPGSYSEVKLGKDAEGKKYPMKWLLDHTLLESAGEGKWEKELSEDSKWFRLDSKLKYPFGLEDMRYQLHVYERK
jgi:25S rRNA (uracil2843-N3)-methyltransferase